MLGQVLVPNFCQWRGRFLCHDLAPEAQGHILGFYVYEEEPQIEYNSLESMLQTFKECYKQGIIFQNEQGYLDMDYRKHAEIAHEINPDLKIWLEFLKETEED